MEKDIDDKLESKEIRPTAMRQLVLKTLIEKGTAMSLNKLEEEFDHADKSTLYRTLKTFEEKKIIHSIDDGTGSLKYAVCQDTCECNPSDLHVHFYCTKCENTFCLTDIPVPTVNLPAGFSLGSVNMVVKGMCANCKR